MTSRRPPWKQANRSQAWELRGCRLLRTGVGVQGGGCFLGGGTSTGPRRTGSVRSPDEAASGASQVVLCRILLPSVVLVTFCFASSPVLKEV